MSSTNLKAKVENVPKELEALIKMTQQCAFVFDAASGKLKQ